MMPNRRHRAFFSEGWWFAAALSVLSLRCGEFAPDEPVAAAGAAGEPVGSEQGGGASGEASGGASGGASGEASGEASGGASGGAWGGASGEAEPEPLILRAERSVLVTDAAILQGLTLERVLFRIAGGGAQDLYRAFALSFVPRAAAVSEPGPRCDDEAPAQNGFSELNGFPVPCPAEARELVWMNENKVWKPLSVTNRFDLAPSDGENCGEQHVSFFLDRGGGLPEFPVQAALRFAAVVDNPSPALGLEGCRPIVDFWAKLSGSDYDSPGARAAALEHAFLGPSPESSGGEDGPVSELGFSDFLSPKHFGSRGRLQLLYQGDRGLWHFFEHALRPTPDDWVLRRPLSQSLPVFELVSRAPESNPCVTELLGALGGLLDDDPAALRMNVSSHCFAGSEATEGATLLDGVRGIVPGGSSGSALFTLIERELSLRYPRYGFHPYDIAARADFAGTCSGCHYLKNTPLSNPGTVAHVNHDRTEPCAAQGRDAERSCYATSPILKLSFLPRWTAILQSFWESRQARADNDSSGAAP